MFIPRFTTPNAFLWIWLHSLSYPDSTQTWGIQRILWLSPQFCDNFQWAARVWGGPPFHAARLPGGPEVERRKIKNRPMKLQVDDETYENYIASKRTRNKRFKNTIHWIWKKKELKVTWTIVALQKSNVMPKRLFMISSTLQWHVKYMTKKTNIKLFIK